MKDKYDNIRHLTRPQYDDFPSMSINDRAAQFSPFAALVGYDDAVSETARLTDSRRALTEDEEKQLNESLNSVIDSLDSQPRVTVTYFVPDEKKSGGRYEDKRAAVRTYDSAAGELVFLDGDRISIDDIWEIRMDDNDDNNENEDRDQKI